MLGPSPRLPGSPLSGSGGLSTLDTSPLSSPQLGLERREQDFSKRTLQKKKKTTKTKQEGTEAEEGDCMYRTGATYPAHFSEPVMSGQVSLFPAF